MLGWLRRGASKRTTSSASSHGVGLRPGYGGGVASVEAAWAQPAMARAAAVIAGTIAGMPKRALDVRGEVVEGHPLLDVLRDPDPSGRWFADGEEMLRGLVRGALEDDWAAVRLVRSAGLPVSARPVRLSLRVAFDDGGLVFVDGSTGEVLQREDLIFVSQSIDVRTGIPRSMPRWSTLTAADELADAQAAGRRALLYGGLGPIVRRLKKGDDAFAFEDEVEAEERDAAEDAALQDRLARRGVVEAPPVVRLGEGEEIDVLGGNARELQVMGAREYTLRQVALATGVPPSVLVGEAMGGAGEAAWRMFVRTTVRNWVGMFESSLAAAAAPARVEFDMRGLLRWDVAEQAQAFKTLREAGMLTPNEGRHRLGLPPQSSEMADSIAAPMNAYQPRRGEDPEGVDGRDV